MSRRDDQREATRTKIIDAAFDVLTTGGYAALSTLAVQRAAQVSRGALLHHFPTRLELCEALIAELVRRNEEEVWRSLRSLPADLDPVSRAVHALYEAMSRPAFQAELGLWAAARTDPELREALRVAEFTVGRDLRRVVDAAFGAEYVADPAYRVVAELTVALVHGLAVAGVLRTSDRAARRAIDHWAVLARQIFDGDLTLEPSASTAS